MNFDGIFNLIDIVILGFGFYALYSAYVLKKEGKIVETFLVFKDTDVRTCKDLQGYANYMSPKLGLLGGFMVAYGGVSVLNTYVVPIETLFWVMFVGFLVVLIWYSFAVKKAMKIYF